MEAMALPELGERWYCPNCTIRKVRLFPLCEFYETFISFTTASTAETDTFLHRAPHSSSTDKHAERISTP
jgi:hypothetical protein